MRIAVISCWKYRDAWQPFFQLFREYWPSCPYPVDIVTDICSANFNFGSFIGDRTLCVYGKVGGNESWCEILSKYAADLNDEPFMLFQEDFFLSSPVNQHLIEAGLEQLERRKAGAVRMYPCPGSDEEYGNPLFGRVRKGSRYRISCQSTIFRPSFLYAIASQFNTPQQFELEGTTLAESLPDEVLAFKRDVKPWPLEYICTSIVSGRWNPDALRLCSSHGILVDRSMRPVL